jgi:hypothetical protein
VAVVCVCVAVCVVEWTGMEQGGGGLVPMFQSVLQSVQLPADAPPQAPAAAALARAVPRLHDPVPRLLLHAPLDRRAPVALLLHLKGGRGRAGAQARQGVGEGRMGGGASAAARATRAIDTAGTPGARSKTTEAGAREPRRHVPPRSASSCAILLRPCCTLLCSVPRPPARPAASASPPCAAAWLSP